MNSIGDKFHVNLTNPIVLLWTTWLVALLICIANIFTVYAPLTPATVTLVTVFLLCLTIAYWFGHQFHFAHQTVHYDGWRLYQVFSVLFALIVLSYVLTIIKLGLPPIFSGAKRSTYYLSSGGELVYLLIYPCFYLGIFIIYHRLLPYHNKEIILQLLILFAMIMTKSNKMTIFTIFLILCNFYGRRVNWAVIAMMAVGVILIFSFASITYTKNVADLNTFDQERYTLTGFALPQSLNFLYDPFIYMASNLYNVSTLLQSNMSGIGMGSLSFKGIYQIVGVFDPAIKQLSTQAMKTINLSATIPNFSTYSALGELYYDFGPIISIEVAMIIGFVSGLLTDDSNQHLALDFFAFILYQTIVLSFFTIYLGNLEVITNLLVMLMVDAFARLQPGEVLVNG